MRLLHLAIVTLALNATAIRAQTANTPITLELSPAVGGSDPDGQASFIVELARANLGNLQGFELVDRSKLQASLDELGLAESALATRPSELQKVGKILGAKYLCYASAMASGKHRMISVRIVQVGSSVYKLAVLQLMPDNDLLTSSKRLAEEVTGKIAELEKRPSLSSEKPVPVPIPEAAVRPVLAVRILESALTRRSADPASEIRLLEHLKQQKFRSVQLSQPGQAVQAGENKLLEGDAYNAYLDEARLNRVDVVILGEAFSETAGRMGPIICSRARVELHAIRVSDKAVLLTASGYGAASDVAEIIAGKIALEHATDQLCLSFPSRLVEGWKTEPQAGK